MTTKIHPDDDAAIVGQPDGALKVLRRGLRTNPELTQGLLATALMGIAVALGRLTVPVVIQQALDRPPNPDGSLDQRFIFAAATVSILVIGLSVLLSWWAQRRLVDRAELAIARLRTRTFEHVHGLSVADHNESKRGILVARVTSDIDSLARFAQWGLFAWTINPIVVVGILGVLAWYSWQLALVVIVVYLPVIPAWRWFQKRQVAAYDLVRTKVGDMLGGFSEVVMGASVIKAYGIERRSRSRLGSSIEGKYAARVRAGRYMASVFVVGDIIGGFALSAVVMIGLFQRDAWGLDPGTIVAALFLVNMVSAPLNQLGETLDQTQTAVAAWRKVLDLLDLPIDVVDPLDGAELDFGPVRVDAIGVGFAYRDGEPVLHDVNVSIPAGTNVAIVGSTGSGKTTFAKLLCRLADPVAGRVELNGVDLRTIDAGSRLASVRMVPQDGFLFNTTVGENVAYGSAKPVSEEEITDAFAALELDWWLERLPEGLATKVGERGDNLSVGERQLVALARAQLADPGLLILDEATSAVDPETDQALTVALRRLAEGRTVVSIAHRLATAEGADLVLVFDHGRLVERGPHARLVAAGGVYAGLHEAWIGTTQTAG